MTALGRAGRWIVLLFALAVSVLQRAVQPLTWRRPVRDEFWRFMDLVCVRNLHVTLITAAIAGVAVVGQGLYWLESVGTIDVIREVTVYVMVREIAPLAVGLLALGSGGMVMFNEFSVLRRGGQLEALDRQGIDPFILLVVPRVVALAIAVFAQSVFFVVVAFMVGTWAAVALGVMTIGPLEFVALLLNEIGAVGYLALPAKSILIGLTIGVICAAAAVTGPTQGGAIAEPRSSTGFIQSMSGMLLVSTILSLII